MERVTGLGGLFFRARDPRALAAWYAEHLGIDDAAVGVWHQEAGPTIFAPFPASSEKFGDPGRQWMPNFRVRDLDAMLEQLRAAGVAVEDGAPVVEEGVGRFAWLADPEGTRIELWEPDPTVSPS